MSSGRLSEWSKKKLKIYSSGKKLKINLLLHEGEFFFHFFEIILFEGFAIKNYAPTFASPYRKDGK